MCVFDFRLNRPLFSDAEAGEDGGEDFGGGDFGGDGSEVVDGFAEVECDEVAGEACVQGVDCALRAVGGGVESVGVALVGDEDAFVGISVFAVGDRGQCVAESVDAIVVFSGYGDLGGAGEEPGEGVDGCLRIVDVGFVDYGYYAGGVFTFGG